MSKAIANSAENLSDICDQLLNDIDSSIRKFMANPNINEVTIQANFTEQDLSELEGLLAFYARFVSPKHTELANYVLEISTLNPMIADNEINARKLKLSRIPAHFTANPQVKTYFFM